MKPLHVVIVNPYDGLPWKGKRRGRYGQLSRELVARGHRVTWFTSDFSHGSKTYRAWPEAAGDANLCIKLLHVPPYSRNISLRRVASHAVYGHRVAKALSALGRSASVDAVVASIPPIESARVAMTWCAENEAAGILDMQDAWPHVLSLAFSPRLRGLAKAILLRPWYRQARMAARSAVAHVAVSPEYLTYMRGLSGAKGAYDQDRAVFPLGYDTTGLPLDRPAGSPASADGVFRVGYIGTFGRFYDLETVIRCANICRESSIEFVLIGDGPDRPRLETLVTDLNLSNTSMKGYVPFPQAVPMLRSCDVGLVPIVSDWPPNTPNKAFDYLFLGLPVVSSVCGTFRDEMIHFGFGRYYEAGDPVSLAKTLRALQKDASARSSMGTSGLAYAKAHMDGSTIYARYVDFLEELPNKRSLAHH